MRTERPDATGGAGRTPPEVVPAADGQPPGSTTGRPEARLDVQVRLLRERLTAEAAAAGLAVDAVGELVDASVASFSGASVRRFIPILVERDVRSALAMPRSGPTRRPG